MKPMSFLAALAASAALSAPVLAAESAPANAKVFSILSAGGKHGEEKVWTDKNGVRHAQMNIVLRGLTYDEHSTTTLDSNGVPTSLAIVGVTPSGDAGEDFTIENGVAKWKSPVDSGEAPWGAGLVYIPYGGPIDTSAVLVGALQKAKDQRLGSLPSGAVSLSELTTLTVSNGKQKKKLKAVAIDGVAFDPQVAWLDEKGDFFGAVVGLAWLPKGWESVREQLGEAQTAALAARAPSIRAKVMQNPNAPVLFRNVTIYDAATDRFKTKQAVLVDGSTIKAVGKTKKIEAPDGAVVIEGKGKTLVPGLWDMHFHTGQDGSGVLALSQGLTSVRDIGNDSKVLLARKKRIDDGDLLGPKIYPIVGIDGDGPLSAQGFERIHSVEEGIATIDTAKGHGYLGIKLYGTIKPDWVKPLADHARSIGLSVQGHIPAGMRPSEAVAAGYTGINHINFIVMEAMPDDVVKTSNGLNRFFGPGRYAKDIDFSKAPMAPFLQTLADKQVVVDPTLTVYEQSFVPDAGELAPGYEHYLGTMPSQVERQFKNGGLVAPEGYQATRADMRASFDKLVETVKTLHHMGVPIVAGTDGLPMDLIRELENYVGAGMTIGEALETATDGAARVLGVEDKVGSIVPGQAADLVLIDADVSKNIGALRQVETVMQAGMLMDGDALRSAAGISGKPHLQPAE
jgi:hypothetical protein